MSTRIRSLATALALSIVSASLARAQGVAINATGAAPDTSAILDLASTSKGFLAPRMTAAQRAAIALPATGLVVYQTDGTAGLYFNAGTSASPSWQAVGTGSGTSQWTTNGTSIYYSAGNVGIQRSAPTARLDVLGGNWDVVNGEGDFRIGDASTRLKIGLATGGGGTGAATIMEQGPVGAYNVLSLGTQGNKVLHVNGTTQRVGIGIDGPTAPLGFAAALGKKVSLYPGGTGDYGFGIASGRLQIFSEAAGTDVAIGSDANGAFTERLAVRNNGALAVNGNAGSAGQVLQSNGAASPPTWVSPSAATYNNVYTADANTGVVVPANSFAALPSMSITFTTATTAKILISETVSVQDVECTFCGGSIASLDIRVDGTAVRSPETSLGNGERGMLATTVARTVAAGTHTVDLVGNAYTKSITYGGGSVRFGNSMDVVVIPQ